MRLYSFYVRAIIMEYNFVELEAVQMELLITVLDNSDGNEKRPTTRAIFLRKFKRFVQDNFVSI